MTGCLWLLPSVAGDDHSVAFHCIPDDARWPAYSLPSMHGAEQPPEGPRGMPHMLSVRSRLKASVSYQYPIIPLAIARNGNRRTEGPKVLSAYQSYVFTG